MFESYGVDLKIGGTTPSDRTVSKLIGAPNIFSHLKYMDKMDSILTKMEGLKGKGFELRAVPL